MSSAEPENKKRRRMQSENEKENNKDNSPTNSFADHSAPRGGRAFAIEVDKAVNERMAEKDKEFDRVNGEIAFKNSLLDSQSEYLKKINNILHCSICMEHMIEPYGLSCGHVGCYECLHAWFTRSTEDDNHRKAKVCPSCRAPIRARPNELYIIKELVQIAALANNESISQPPQRTGDVWEGVFRPGGEYGPIEDREDGVLRCGRCSGELLHGICTMCGEIYTDAEDEDEEEEEEEDEDEEVYADPADELERVSRLNLPFSIIGVSDSEHSSQRTESEEHDSDSDGNEHPRNSQNHNDENIWRGIRENEESESESDDFISDGGSVESRNRSGSRGLGAPVEYIHSDDEEEEEEEEEASSTSSSSSSSRQSESESESEASSSSREVNPTRRHNAGVIELSDDDNNGDGIPTSIPPRSRRRAIISDDDDDE